LLTLTEETGQTMRGWGFGISLENEGLEPLVSGEMSVEARRRALDLLVAEAGTNIVRIFSPGFGSTPVIEPENDNSDPFDLDLDGFRLDVTGRLTLMEDLAPRGVRFLLTGGAAPSWMKDGRLLRPDMAAEFAEYLVAYAVWARRSVGVDFDWITVANEGDNDAMRLLIDPETSADVLAALAGLLPLYDLPARLVVGDTIGWSGADEFLEAALAESEVVPRLDAVAAHSYQSRDARPQVAERAGSAGIEVWMTEQSAAGGKDCLGDDPGMNSALQWARWIMDDLVDGKASVWLALRGVATLCHDPQGGLLVYDTAADRLTIPKRFYAFSHFAQAAPPGSKLLVVERAGEHDAIPAVAFDRGKDVAVVIVNNDAVARTLEVIVPWAGSAVSEVRMTSESMDAEPSDPPVVVDGRVALTLPPKSILTLVVTKPSS
jgi:O-glycosyl hydrolase